jgi:hypothetical protein
MTEILSEELLAVIDRHCAFLSDGDAKMMIDLLASHRALHSQLEARDIELGKQDAEIIVLHSQVRELKRDRDNLFALKEARNSELTEARARITALEADLYELQGTPQARFTWIYEQLIRVLGKESGYNELSSHGHDHKFIEAIEQLQQRITLLEGALKHVTSLCGPNPVWKDVVEKALHPGHYREWCRDPKLCQDKGTCPKDPSCAD